MPVKLYKSGGVIKVEESGYDTINFNTATSKYLVFGSKFFIKDNITKIEKELGVYTNVIDKDDNVFSSEQALINWLDNNVSSVTLGDGQGAVNDDNPLPVNNVDTNKRMGLNTVFGESITGMRVPTIAAQFQYGIQEGEADITQDNGATVTTSDSLLKLNTGVNVAGKAIIQTREYLRYLPGHEAFMFFTAVFNSPIADSYQRAGLFDENNGFFVGYKNTGFYVTRLRDGVQTDVIIDVNSVFDSSDGVFDPTKGNIYRLSFGYLGFASVSFEILTPKGAWRLIHKIEYPNSSELTHILQTNLPARAEIANTGNNTDLQLSSGSFEIGIIDGSSRDPSSRLFSDANNEIAITEGEFEVITARVRTTFNSIENRIKIQLLLVSIATVLNKAANWRLIKNATITNVPTWANFNTNNSVVELSTDATINTSTGQDILAFNMSKEESFFEIVDKLEVFLRAGDYVTFLLTTASGATGTVNLAVRWKELF